MLFLQAWDVPMLQQVRQLKNTKKGGEVFLWHLRCSMEKYKKPKKGVIYMLE